MHWSFVVVHILIIAVISNYSFPIDLKELEPDDIFLVDKARKGRFIQVNQTTFLPNPIELIRAKKSSQQNVEKSDEEVVSTPDNFNTQEKSPTPVEVKPSTIDEQKSFNGQELIGQSNFANADSIFDSQTFGYPSFFEDQFNGRNHQPYFINSLLTDDSCCHLEKLVSSLTGNLPCINEFIVPEENLFC